MGGLTAANRCAGRRLAGHRPGSAALGAADDGLPVPVDEAGWEAEGKQEGGGWFTELDRTVVTNALACGAAGMADPLMSLVDTAFVGRVGVEQLAALGPATALFNVLFFVSFMAMATVATDQMAVANGRGDKVELGKAMSLSLTATVVVGIVCTLALFAAPETLLRAFQTNTEMMPYAKEYLLIRGTATLASQLMVIFQSAFRATLDLRTPLIVVLLAGAVNAVLDPILIFVCGWGIGGAAAATAISQFFGCGLFIWLTLRRKASFGLDAVMSEAESKTEKKSTRAAMWTLVSDLEWGGYIDRVRALTTRSALILGCWTGAACAATSLGTAYAAGYQIIHQVLQLQLAVAWSFLSVGQTMVANVFERSLGAARKVTDRVLFWGAFTASLLALLTYLCQDLLASLFTSDPTVLALVSAAFLPAVVMLAASCNNAVEGCLLGVGDGAFIVKAYPIGVALQVGALWYVLKNGLGLAGIWWTMVLYYAALLVMFTARAYVPALGGPLAEEGVVVKSD